MRKEAKGVLKSLPAPPRSLSNPFQLSKILGEEGNDLIGLPIVERANHNGMGREEWHKKTRSNPKSEYRNPCLRRSGFAQAGGTNFQRRGKFKCQNPNAK
jgi:hypothetical protein